jgi:hypothetical protein
VAVAAVGRGHDVAVAQVRADANRNGLLARIEMEKASELPRGHQLGELLLEAADRAHLPVGVEQGLARQVHDEILPGRAIRPRDLTAF